MAEPLPADRVLLFPAQEPLAAEAAIASPEMLAQRIDALTKLAGGFRGIVVVPYAGMRAAAAGIGRPGDASDRGRPDHRAGCAGSPYGGARV
ncbi:hypothetical protein LJK88_48430 [Paenibacillus sp. P26]|nr:hypothetical protein LJK88_48430 [Paenibacillus sp. P26]